MPPTTGHLQLIQFAKGLSDHVVVMFTSQPDEPFAEERALALQVAIDRVASLTHTEFIHYTRPMDPNPESDGFRDRWAGIMIGAGANPGDLLVISESWGRWLAEMTEMDWRPYDIAREINATKGTRVREDPYRNWDAILPEFRKHLQVRVTIFGAESVGKTTLAQRLREVHHGNSRFPACTVLPEYARPYLENTVNEITVRSMKAIWEGQRALQRQEYLDHPLIVQDTDLLSTWGYWKYWTERIDQKRNLGWPPDQLYSDARELKSDLYIMPPSVVPFEPDPLRYGGDRREIEDDYWINLCSWQNLNFRILGRAPEYWVSEATEMIRQEMKKKAELMVYDRNGY
jgi:nicotinamide riboside kinase